MPISLHLLRVIIFSLGLLVLGWLAMQVGQGAPQFAILASVAVVGLFVLLQPGFLLVLAFAFTALPLTTPYFPNQLNFSHLAMLALGGVVVLRLVTRQLRFQFSAMHWMCVALGIQLLVLMMTRGVGFLQLGDGSVGGMRYIHTLAAIGLVFAAGAFALRPGYALLIFWLLAIGSLGMMVAELLVSRGIGVNFISPFLRFNEAAADLQAVASLRSESVGIELSRVQSGQAASAFVLLLALILVRPRQTIGLPGILSGPVLVFSLVLAAVAGFRMAILRLVMVGGFALWFDRGITVQRVLILAVLVAVGVSVAYVSAPYLPGPAQRALSFLPEIEIREESRQTASETIEWRLAVWRTAVEEVPNYLWLGKGWTFDANAFIHSQVTPIDWALLNLTFHNGPLGLLITMGIPGTLIVICLHLTAIWRHVRFTREAWQHERLLVAHRVATAYLVTEILLFWLVYGDPYLSLPAQLFAVGLVEILRATEMRYRASLVEANRAKTEAETPSLPEPPSPVSRPLPHGLRQA